MISMHTEEEEGKSLQGNTVFGWNSFSLQINKPTARFTILQLSILSSHPTVAANNITLKSSWN